LKTFRILAIVIVVCGAILVLVLSPGASEDYKLSDYSFLPAYDSSSVVFHSYYSLSYNEESEQPYWVAYSLKPANLESRFGRRNIFREDTMVKSGTATNRDYSRSGYDRGHLVPAGDMSFDSIALEESFYYSNISPQLAGFNRGVWKRLEDYTRDHSLYYDSLIVISGPVINSSAEGIGENRVSIPVFFYKILIQFRADNVYVTSYLLPHVSSQSDLSEYIVSVDSIEALTGIDFLYDLPDKLEDRLERR
jgi:endonuclease G